jgi:hypothetical protein
MKLKKPTEKTKSKELREYEKSCKTIGLVEAIRLENDKFFGRNIKENNND